MPPSFSDQLDAVNREYNRLYAALEIDRHNLDTMLMEHPRHRADVSKLHADCQSYRDGVKERLDYVRARADNAIRDEHETAVQATPTGQKAPKLTEANISMRLLQDETVIAAKAAVSDWDAMLIKVQGLSSGAYTDRNFMLTKLGDLWIAGYWSTDAIRPRPPADGPSRREQHYDRQREELAAARHDTGASEPEQEQASRPARRRLPGG